MPLIASCHCGATKIQAPVPTSATECNCTYCARTGAVWAYYKPGEMQMLSQEGEATYSASEAGNLHHFCGRCGSNVWWEPQRMPDLVGVAVGAFADPEFPPPQQAVFARDRHVWVELPEDVPEFPASPPPRPSNS